MTASIKTPMGPTKELLKGAIEGDQSAFAKLVLKHQAMVFSIAYRFLRDRATAEELAQDVFLALFQNLHTIKSDEHLVFWLRRVTGNRCIDFVRKQKPDKLVGLEDVPEMSVEIQESDPFVSRLIRNVLVTLAEKPRLIVILRYQEEMEPAEIAEILEMPLATVKSHLRRSLVVLREKVKRRLGVRGE